ncbi:glycolate oxidase subunit GlcF [Thiolapillus sp.]
MDTRLAPRFDNDSAAQEAQKLLRSCVHCGFCTATCPTYQLLGDELDGPRGRIYLIRQLLESGRTSRQARTHLDRCLLCRSCETTCPSGVEYSRLLHIGRHLSQEVLPLPLGQRLLRAGLRGILPHPKRVRLLLRLGRWTRPFLPASLRRRLPRRSSRGKLPRKTHERKVLLFQGCVQSAAARNINAATRRVLDRLGIQCLELSRQQCCGAVHHHLGADEQAREQARRNIDSWLPRLQQGAEVLLVTASACALEIREYPLLFTNDPAYRQKAVELLQHCQEIGTFLSHEDIGRIRLHGTPPLAFHAPCTLQHGLGSADSTRELLSRLGFDLREPADRHLCCGAAGTYSILQPQLADRLGRDKLEKLQETGAANIASANIGCLLHLQERTEQPVRHWIEWLDELLAREDS